MFHYPHRSIEKLKTVESTEFESFTAVYNHYYTIHPDLHPSDYYKELSPIADNDEFEENPSYKDEIVRSDL